MEHLVPVKMYKLHRSVDLNIPFERVLGEGQSVEVRWTQHLRDTGLDTGRARGVKLHNFSDKIFVRTVDCEGEGFVSDLWDGWAGTCIGKKSYIWSRTIFKYLSAGGTIRRVFNNHLNLIEINPIETFPEALCGLNPRPPWAKKYLMLPGFFMPQRLLSWVTILFFIFFSELG